MSLKHEESDSPPYGGLSDSVFSKVPGDDYLKEVVGIAVELHLP